MNYIAALQLARFLKPQGTLLLWAPTAWALWIANHGNPPVSLVLLFLLGTVFMRAAGCIINDMVDKDIDPFVKRTKERPLALRVISLQDAFVLLFVLLLAALLVLIQLPFDCFYLALISLLLTVIYPFCKRFIHCPQLVLGITFSMGIPMAFMASNDFLNPMICYVFAINFLWILAYDTQYAMADRADDLKIGVKSSAILFGSYDRQIIASFQIVLHLLWLPLAIDLELSWFFYLCWFMGIGIFMVQHYLLKTQEEINYVKAFSSNVWYGCVLWAGLVCGFC